MKTSLACMCGAQITNRLYPQTAMNTNHKPRETIKGLLISLNGISGIYSSAFSDLFISLNGISGI
jgi:hypothetical protein